MKHSSDWQTTWYGHTNYKALWFGLAIALRAKVILETGLSMGGSTRTFLEAAKILDGHVWTVDITEYPNTVQELTKLGLTDRWTFMQGDSTSVAYDGPKIDLLFLDSDHATTHVYRELEHWTPHLNPHGFIMTDDTADGPNKEQLPYRAFEQWVDTHAGWSCVNLTIPPGNALMWQT